MEIFICHWLCFSNKTIESSILLYVLLLEIKFIMMMHKSQRQAGSISEPRDVRKGHKSLSGTCL